MKQLQQKACRSDKGDARDRIPESQSTRFLQRQKPPQKYSCTPRRTYGQPHPSRCHTLPTWVLWAKKGFLVCSSNCAVIGIVIPFAAIQAKFGPVDQASVVTKQAVSGAGYPGVSSMDIRDNVVPFISREEDKLESEVPKILGSVSSAATSFQNQCKLKISAACNRLAVLDGHTACLFTI